MSKINRKIVCPNCYNTISVNNRICPYCGKILEDNFKNPIFIFWKELLKLFPYFLLFFIFIGTLLISDINKGKSPFIDNFLNYINNLQLNQRKHSACNLSDFSSYIKDVQNSVHQNWKPPIDKISKRVVVLFEISADGSLIKNEILESSGVKEYDDAAINAVKSASPFPPFPPHIKDTSKEIQLTMDYNISSCE